MTLSPGQSWGSVGLLPVDAPVVSTDADLAALVGETNGDESPLVVGLAAGDLCMSLGGRGDVATRRGSEVTLLPIDIGQASCDDDPRPRLFAAHLVARGSMWAGPGAVVMNAERLGQWLPAPRAHPGDGRLDVVEGRLGVRERFLARSRVRTGDHVPHPELTVRRVPALTLAFAKPRRVLLDGNHVGHHRRLEIQLLPNAVVVAV